MIDCCDEGEEKHGKACDWSTGEFYSFSSFYDCISFFFPEKRESTHKKDERWNLK